jgi:hypothetical protein
MMQMRAPHSTLATREICEGVLCINVDTFHDPRDSNKFPPLPFSLLARSALVYLWYYFLHHVGNM